MNNHSKTVFVSFLYLFLLLLLFPFAENVKELSAVNNSKYTDGGSDIFDKYNYMLMKYRDPQTGQIPKNIRIKESAFISSVFESVNSSKNGTDSYLQNNWLRRGPINIGGRTRALALDIRDENILLAGGVSGGMWRSTDRGLTWTRVTDLGQLSSVSCIAQDIRRDKEDVWYYGTGEFFGNSAALLGNGIFKSTNNGLTWEQLESTMNGNPVAWDNQFDYIWRIVVNHTNLQEDELYAAFSLGGISRSIDGGESWSNVLGGFGNNRSYVSDIAISPSGVLYAALSEFAPRSEPSVTRGIYRSTDGTNWIDITPPDMPEKYNRIIIGIAPSDENQVYFAAETPGTGHLTYRRDGEEMWHSFWKYTFVSGDGTGEGGIWENRSENLPYSDIDIREHLNSQRGYNFDLKVKPDNPDIVFLAATNLYRSNNGFKTKNSYKWIGGYGRSIPGKDYQEYPNHHPDVHTLFFSYTNPDILYTGSDGGVHRTNNCLADSVVYDNLNHTYFTTQYYSIALDHEKGSTKLAGGLQDNTTLVTFSDDVNDDWHTVTKGDGFNCQFKTGGDILYSSRNSLYQPKIKVYRTKFDEQGNIVGQRRIDPDKGADFIWNTPLILDPNNQNRMFLAGGHVVWRNNDLNSIPFDNSLDSTSIGWDSLSHTYMADEMITAIAASNNPADIVYYGTSGGKVFRIDNADAGNPQPVNITGSNFQSSYTSCIAIDPDDAGHVFAVFSNYGVLSIYYSSDSGNSWSPISGNLEEYPNGSGSGPAVNWLSIVKVNDKKLYIAGTSSGLFVTTFIDGMGTIWAPEASDMIGNVPVDMIDVRHSDNYVAVATHGTGTYSSFINYTPEPPGATELISPANDTGGVKKNVLFQWKPVQDAISYTVQVSMTEDFLTLFVEKKGILKTETYINIPEEVQRVYYWRVFAVNAGGYSKSSEEWKFLSAAEPPVLLYPEYRAENVPLNTELRWTFLPCCSGYHLQVSKSLTYGSKMVVDTIVSITPFVLENLEPNKRHYWRIASIDGWGEGSFSKSSIFKTVAITSVNRETGSNQFVISRIYPNPNREFATIDFNLPATGLVEIWLKSITGNNNIKLYDNILQRGSNEYRINTRNLSSGYYLVVIRQNGKQISKSMMIVR